MIEPAKPSVERLGGFFRASWPDEHVTFEIDRIVEHHDEIRGQLTVQCDDLILTQFNYNLTSLPARDKAAKYLKQKEASIDWAILLEMACHNIVAQIRSGEPRLDLCTMDQVTPLTWLCKPLIPKDVPTMIFADGGSGKSYLSLIVSMIIGFPWQNNPLGWEVGTTPIKSLLLDWETEHSIVNYRLKRLCDGMGEPRPPLEYRRCTRPLAADLSSIQKHVLESEAELLIVDSVGMACGGDLKEQSSATGFFQALRELKITSLLLTHMAKDELRKTKTAFGSIYFQNHSRSVWELTKAQDPETDSIKMALFQRKQNEMALQRPIVIELEFNNVKETTVFRRSQLDDTPDLIDKLPIKEQIRLALKHGPRSIPDLAADLDKSEGTIRTTLNKYRGSPFTKVGEKWALVTHAEP